ncbi:DUF6499 domain-containing protein [Nitratireductor sp. ac15]|nr:hypothetical protein EJV44_11485 [Ancylobacter aquaticus]
MTPDASGWRSPKGYEHVDDMTASDLAWEWLRRNESYDKDFQALTATKEDPRPLIDKIGQRWGLRFPGGPIGRPTPSACGLAHAGRYKRHRPWRGASRFFRKR